MRDLVHKEFDVVFGALSLRDIDDDVINSLRLTIGSAVLRAGDFVRLTDAATLMESTLQCRLSPRLTLPSYL